MNEMHPSSKPQEPLAASPLQVSFHAHIALLHFFLSRRSAIVERIDQLLNAQRKPLDYQQDLSLPGQQLKDAFFTLPTITREQAGLRDQLEHAHWQSGFQPRANPGNDIIDPAALMLRAFHFWRQTRWPGQKGRVRYAHTLFNTYLLRCLALLNMRLWDDDASDSSERLAHAQDVLDALWRSTPADQPVLVRDVRWLFPVVMSPTTDDLSGYFDVAAHIARTFTGTDQVETQKAWVQTAGGHLRSQLRHLCAQQGVGLDDHHLMLLTRRSNALDIALLMQGLVTLLRAYQRAIASGDRAERLVLAQAIYQGISPDPGLFLNRVDLLGPYSMIEYLFISVDAQGSASYTAMGQRHLQLLQQYRTLIADLVSSLHEDCLHTPTAAAAYSPFGALYGFASNVLELMAFKTLQLDAETRFSMEDVFSAGDQHKRAWVNQWRDLPHISRDVVQQFAYPEQFAEDVHVRISQALQRCIDEAATGTAIPLGRLFMVSDDDAPVSQKGADVAELSVRYVVSSDPQLVGTHKAGFKEQQDLLYCRLEGEFLVSYQTPGGWVGISKDVLTEVVGAGQHARLAALPAAAGGVLELMCPGLIRA